ncbi:hypothetical protein [Vibrio phage CKB-S1]|nr:hypothetical protein [Vibrio phage CKB-S1]
MTTIANLIAELKDTKAEGTRYAETRRKAHHLVGKWTAENINSLSTADQEKITEVQFLLGRANSVGQTNGRIGRVVYVLENIQAEQAPSEPTIANDLKEAIKPLFLLDALFFVGARATKQSTRNSVMTFEFEDGSIMQIQNWNGHHPAGFEYTARTQDAAA